MQLSKIFYSILAALALYSYPVFSQNDSSLKSITLNDLSAFADPPANWSIAGDASADYTKPQDIKAIKGTGAVVDDFSKNNRMHLYTKEEFGDLEVSLDFMMARNSNSGIYFQGRYEVQLLDSWTRLNPAASDVGGIYSRWTPARGTFEGTPPLMNVARAPGLWQHLNIKFRAARFNQAGEKIRNAFFESVYLNGILVQQLTTVTGPTGSSMFTDEKSRGPLVLQGDHGPVAFKNITYRELPPLQEVNVVPTDYSYWESRNPILINPQSRNYLLRSFMDYGQKILTHVISVGSPAEVNYSYDLKQGALVYLWRGKFLDVTRMWVGRGEPQRARPLGSVITLGDAPSLSVLNNEKDNWPDSVAFDELQQHGYLLNKQRSPVFSYSLSGTEVKDSIAFETAGEGLTRAIMVSNPPANFYCRVIEGKNIERVNDDLYVVDDRSFYIKLNKKFKPVLRSSPKGKEIIVRYQSSDPLIYSIIW